jgi:Zyg-11 family protein
MLTCVEQLILPAMEAHPWLCGLQTAATVCLYKLTKGDLVKRIDLRILKQVVELTLTAMENFPIHYHVSTILNLCG